MAKRKQLTPMQEAFLRALMSKECGGDFRKAMDAAGYSKNYHPADIIRDLKDEIIERAEYLLAQNAPKAALAMIGVIDDPTALGNKDKMLAAREVMDRVGLSKKERLEVKSDTPNALFILPAKNFTKTIAEDDEIEYNSDDDE